MNHPWMRAIFVLAIGLSMSRTGAEELAWPAERWEFRRPDQVGLSREKLDALRDRVGGRGCVVRHGYMVYTWGDQSKSGDVASAVKPVISTLLLFAVQEGKIKSVDDPVVAFEPRLRMINNGKDAAITWRHLASQTSGYGLIEKPGQAYSYNDYALALYYDTLMNKVYQARGTDVLKRYLGQPLQFEDRYSFEVFGPKDRPGRLGISVRDFARFGLFCLRGGQWRGRQLLQKQLIDLAIHSPIPAEMPLTSGKEADMLPGQRSIGGGKNITPDGPGWYSFNWWINGLNKRRQRLFDELPTDTFIASGHGGRRMMTIIPTWDLIVVWNDSKAMEGSDANQHKAMAVLRDAIR